MKDLSIIIPANNEMFLSRTIEDILQHIEADTEVIAVLDGMWAKPEIVQNERVNVIYVPQSIGQRAATNLGVNLSKAKYVMKCDAHCTFDQGFDRKMIEAFKQTGDNVTMVPIMRNLWAFDWKCYRCGWKKYQGPTPLRCGGCNDSRYVRRKMLWIGKERPQSASYCFDSEPHFQYFGDYTRRQEYRDALDKTGLTETMSLQGSCFMLTKAKYLEFAVGREELGSWGNEGLEMACKTWLSGGRVLVNHKTWYAHMFRTQGGDFGFPYEQHGRDVDRTKKKVWDFFTNGKWSLQKYPVSWLVRRFSPILGWDEDKIKELESKENGII